MNMHTSSQTFPILHLHILRNASLEARVYRIYLAEIFIISILIGPKLRP